ncbi:MAG: flagellar hook-length control protein FliK [Oscillospiraceae bacterium]|nr:flagellar hook-length control protein FliK [Oscillospiraceae bacterium]
MRVDASSVLAQGGVKIKAGNETADSLKKGDILKASVVSSDKNGTVALKTETGLSFSAKLDAPVKLSPGDAILLEVTENDKGQVSLVYKGLDNADDDLSVGQKNLVKDFSDKSLAPFASKLSELNMPVTEETARVMRDLIQQNPGLKLDEAAFLASNKLTGDESLMKAALAVLGDGEKTDAMIAKLLSLLGEQSAPSEPGAGMRNPETGGAGVKLPGMAVPGESSPSFTVNTANSAPLTELLTTIVKSFSGVLTAPVQGDGTPGAMTQTIITQPDANMQTNAQENLLFSTQENGNPLQQGALGGVQNEASQLSAAVNMSQGIHGIEENLSSSAIKDPSVPGNAIPSEANTPESQPAGNSGAAAADGLPQNTAQSPQPAQDMGSVVARLLSDIPQFQGTPQSALQRFSEMLLRVAGDTGDAPNNTEALANQLNKLFTRIGRDDSDAGARLKDAREELFTRLSLIEEAISRAAQPARAEMLVQTQKLMDHVRLLNSIEQFVYMQLPVQLSEEKKTADLYVFKRKGRKNADPDNVNILLAIDLEFMGHWEALVNIKNKDVSIQMEVPGAAEKDHFNSNTVLLHNMLDEAGFKLVSTNIKFSEEETTPLTALSTLDRYTGGKQGIIDFRI